MIDAEFRVVGESRWAPFKRWIKPKLIGLAQILVIWAFATAILYVLRYH